MLLAVFCLTEVKNALLNLLDGLCTDAKSRLDVEKHGRDDSVQERNAMDAMILGGKQDLTGNVPDALTAGRADLGSFNQIWPAFLIELSAGLLFSNQSI